MTPFGTNATFKADWSGVGDFLARVGLGFNQTQTADQIGTISSDFSFTETSTNGSGYIGLYGWSVNPLHEFYVVEDWIGSRRPVPGTKVGTITVDGAAYDVMTHTQNNQPAITGGNATFEQFFSIRQTPRTCGHISASDHFSQWASLGLQLGNLEEVKLLVEAFSSTGSIEFDTATVVVK